MKAIILAAGKGSRISDEIGPIPKSTLEIGGKPIIRRTVELLQQYHIEVAVCTGYRRRKIEEALEGLKVSYFNNPFYDVTNNIASLWFAQDFLKGDDCLVLSADVIFDRDLLEKLMQMEGDLIMVTDSSRVADGDYFFHMAEDGTIAEYGPDIPMERRDYEYVGIDKISKGSIDSFKGTLLTMIEEGKTQGYFEYVFFYYIGHPYIRLTTLDISGCVWREVDCIDDYNKAVKELCRNAQGDGVQTANKEEKCGE